MSLKVTARKARPSWRNMNRDFEGAILFDIPFWKHFAQPFSGKNS